MIFGVRRLVPDEYGLLRGLRLRSLAAEPTAYGSTYEREVAFTESDWRHRLRPDGNPHFVCTDGAGDPVGIVAVALDESDRTTAYLLGMWVEPHARGTGAADVLVAEVVRRAETERCLAVRLHVTEGNGRAEGLYLRSGFERTGRSFVRDRDGLTEFEMVHHLNA